MEKKRHILFVVLAYLICIADVTILMAKTHDNSLKDPIILGHMIFIETCLRCHTGTEQFDLAEEFTDKAELILGISGEGCNTNWAEEGGGPFDKRELRGLAAYLIQINETRTPVISSALPALHTNKAKIKNNLQKTKLSSKPSKNTIRYQLTSPLQKLIKSNIIAKGGWLYTKNCYRCHLTYQQARMGKSLPIITIERLISEGKTSTQMKPFSRMLGGKLKNNEITAIAQYIFTWEKNEEPLAIAEELMCPPALDPTEYNPIRLSQFKTVRGDLRNGDSLYKANCKSCHGINGEGFIGSSLQHSVTVRRDLYFKSIVKNGVPGSLMKAWDQNRGGLLSAKQIDDVVSHVLL